MRTTLTKWAAKQFDPVPSLHVLRRLVRDGRINPQPQLVGREYYVEETATLRGLTDRLGGR